MKYWALGHEIELDGVGEPFPTDGPLYEAVHRMNAAIARLPLATTRPPPLPGRGLLLVFGLQAPRSLQAPCLDAEPISGGWTPGTLEPES